MIIVSVRCALRTVGARKARTPLLTASTPVIAVQPFEKTCRSSHKLTDVAAGSTTLEGWRRRREQDGPPQARFSLRR
jgi:hypothetical protein